LGSPGARESVTMPPISFLSCARGAEQRDGVVVALAHLAAVQAGQGGHVLVDHRFGQREVLAVQVVEAGGHVARHLDVLHLVAAHGHLVGVEHQDVGAHQHGVHEQARGHAVVGLAPGFGWFLSCAAL
jgi:hypothetical protein